MEQTLAVHRQAGKKIFPGETRTFHSMSTQPILLALIEGLTAREKAYCRQLAAKHLPASVRRYLLALLDADPGSLHQTEQDLLRYYSESGKRWLRRTALNFLEHALYDMYGLRYDFRLILNQLHLAIQRGHPSAPLVRLLRRRFAEITTPLHLFFVPLPWLVELVHISLSYPGRSITGKSPFSVGALTELMELDRQRLEAIRYTVEHDPVVGEGNPALEELYGRLKQMEAGLWQMDSQPFHRTVLFIYGAMALLYDQVGAFGRSYTLVQEWLSLLPVLTAFVQEEVAQGRLAREWAELTVFMTIVALQVVDRTMGWEQKELSLLRQVTADLLELLSQWGEQEPPVGSEPALRARAAAWLATHGFLQDAYAVLRDSGEEQAYTSQGLRPIERVDLAVAHYWWAIDRKDWQGALSVVARLERAVPQKPLYYHLTEVMRFQVALLSEDYELLKSTAERVYHWNRRHKELFPSLGRFLRYVALRAPRAVYPSDWDPVVERLADLYRRYPFYLTLVEKPVRLLETLKQFSTLREKEVPLAGSDSEPEVPLKPLKTVIAQLIAHIEQEQNASFRKSHEQNEH